MKTYTPKIALDLTHEYNKYSKYIAEYKNNMLFIHEIDPHQLFNETPNNKIIDTIVNTPICITFNRIESINKLIELLEEMKTNFKLT